VTFDAVKSKARKNTGLDRAASYHEKILKMAQQKAIEFAIIYGPCTADDVYELLFEMGYVPSGLGNAAGAIFKGKGWHFTGEWRTSTRVSNHARQNRVWEWMPTKSPESP
jgi:hypothetical protein